MHDFFESPLRYNETKWNSLQIQLQCWKAERKQTVSERLGRGLNVVRTDLLVAGFVESSTKVDVAVVVIGRTGGSAAILGVAHELLSSRHAVT